MNRTKYAMMVILNVVPFIAMAMNQGAVALLSESKQKARVKSARGEYITQRSDERKQQSSALAKIPVYGLKPTINSGRELSRASHVTARRKTPHASVSAETLYDQAMFLYPAKSGSHLNKSMSIAQKIGFDESIKRGDVEKTVRFLNANNGLRNSYPLAIKLYAIMTSQANTLDIHPSEAAIIPIQNICDIAKRLAIFGYNEQFLENYARIMHEDPTMRRIIQGGR